MPYVPCSPPRVQFKRWTAAWAVLWVAWSTRKHFTNCHNLQKTMMLSVEGAQVMRARLCSSGACVLFCEQGSAAGGFEKTHPGSLGVRQAVMR